MLSQRHFCVGHGILTGGRFFALNFFDVLSGICSCVCVFPKLNVYEMMEKMKGIRDEKIYINIYYIEHRYHLFNSLLNRVWSSADAVCVMCMAMNILFAAREVLQCLCRGVRACV